jgi:hypothetical protein
VWYGGIGEVVHGGFKVEVKHDEAIFTEAGVYA